MSGSGHARILGGTAKVEVDISPLAVCIGDYPVPVAAGESIQSVFKANDLSCITAVSSKASGAVSQDVGIECGSDLCFCDIRIRFLSDRVICQDEGLGLTGL